ncbi:hypothetical protein CEXT_746001 [Caerostris extrusa]|uniref:Uncharacterized protein n=1 Tax=Caerostris extrusa TaxID=172846 RepID=A0AAV4VWE7_CAEEX|nr:hypothetical protein CEXT_746001 [Caerostris extrusa]
MRERYRRSSSRFCGGIRSLPRADATGRQNAVCNEPVNRIFHTDCSGCSHAINEIECSSSFILVIVYLIEINKVHMLDLFP